MSISCFTRVGALKAPHPAADANTVGCKGSDAAIEVKSHFPGTAMGCVFNQALHLPPISSIVVVATDGSFIFGASRWFIKTSTSWSQKAPFLESMTRDLLSAWAASLASHKVDSYPSSSTACCQEIEAGSLDGGSASFFPSTMIVLGV